MTKYACKFAHFLFNCNLQINTPILGRTTKWKKNILQILISVKEIKSWNNFQFLKNDIDMIKFIDIVLK